MAVASRSCERTTTPATRSSVASAGSDRATGFGGAGGVRRGKGVLGYSKKIDSKGGIEE